MRVDTKIYDALATVLTYPGEDYHGVVEDCIASANRGVVPKEAHDLLSNFAEQVRRLSIEQAQEQFTQTFDLNPLCSLELGWHLFGENYDRGIMLVRMREQLRRHNIPETTELPDHLTYALRLLARMKAAAAEDFAGAIVLPALARMLAALKNKQTPYENVLAAVRQIVHGRFPELPLEAPQEAALPVLEAGGAW